MKKLIFFFVLFIPAKFIYAQDAATTHSEFTYLGKTYTANYDEAKHVLTVSEEMSIEIYDETGSCVKRQTGTKVDFKTILKVGEEKTFTVRFYKKQKKKLLSFRKNVFKE